jgi:REP element-mobilizing transposase RayT
VTICVRQGECLLGEVVDGEMQRNEWVQIAWNRWHTIPDHFPHVELDAYVVMPNHVHGIIVIAGPVGAQHAAPLPQSGPRQPAPRQSAPLQPLRTNVQPGSLGAIVRSLKSSATKRINELRNMPGTPFWQRNYWEHIIRDEASLNRIREYIETNPARWTEDHFHPGAPPNPFNRWPAEQAWFANHPDGVDEATRRT